MHSDAIRAALAAVLLVAPGAASALTIYENDFETGDITDFVLTEATVATGLSADFIAVDSPAIGDGALRVALTKQQNTGNDLNPIARVTAEIFVPVAASDYVLDISARTSVCNGCVVSYDVLMDGGLLERDADTAAFAAESYALGFLSVGVHLLTLGVHLSLIHI